MKLKSWFTKTRIIVYGALSALVLLGGGMTVITSGIQGISLAYERADSTLFVRWHTPCDQLRTARETELYYTGMRTQYLLQELVSDEERERAENKFRSDSTRWSRGNIK